MTELPVVIPMLFGSAIGTQVAGPNEPSAFLSTVAKAAPLSVVAAKV